MKRQVDNVRITNYELRITNYELRIANYELGGDLIADFSVH